MAGKYKRKPHKASTDVVAMLKRARALVKRGWCQDVLARDKRGIRCNEKDVFATSWCVVGATYRACSNRFGPSDDAWSALTAAARTHDLAGWNDRTGRKQADVVALFDRAIAKAEVAP